MRWIQTRRSGAAPETEAESATRATLEVGKLDTSIAITGLDRALVRLGPLGIEFSLGEGSAVGRGDARTGA